MRSVTFNGIFEKTFKSMNFDENYFIQTTLIKRIYGNSRFRQTFADVVLAASALVFKGFRYEFSGLN